MIDAGLCDAAIIGGADTLCATTLFGFHALGVMAEGPCRPVRCRAQRHFDRRGRRLRAARTRRARGTDAETMLLLGAGESSDAYHMSSPHPEGAGAAARHGAGTGRRPIWHPADIDYINLHGTATLGGRRRGGPRHLPACSAALCRAVQAKALPAIRWALPAWSGRRSARSPSGTGFCPAARIPTMSIPLSAATICVNGREARIDQAMSNAFGFGGVNCSLVLGRAS